MSGGKTSRLKRLLISVVLMLAVLLAVNGLCALLMSGGIIDHHLTTQGACVAWGSAAMVAAASVLRVKDSAVYERWLAPLIVLLLVLLVSLVMGQVSRGGGLWWKCGVSTIAGVIASSLLVSKKKKKYAGGGGKRKKAKRR